MNLNKVPVWAVIVIVAVTCAVSIITYDHIKKNDASTVPKYRVTLWQGSVERRFEQVFDITEDSDTASIVLHLKNAKVYAGDAIVLVQDLSVPETQPEILNRLP